MLSSLVGNHATIRVPYDFDGIVIYASTRSHQGENSIVGMDPFIAGDPQWKPARYLTDVNIVKPNSDGRHSSSDGNCSGTAVFIEGYRSNVSGSSTFIWGLNYSGLRIAGAFKFGVYGTNNYIWVDKATGEPIVDEEINEETHEKKWAWTNDMKVNGIIDGCEIGVYLSHCNNAYISTIIQPRAAEDDDKTKYAKYGILLEESQYVDLTGSRVWDWDKKHTLGGPEWDTTNPKASKDYQHIGLIGNCKGLLLDDFLYHRMDDYDIRDLIYTDTPENFDTMSVLQAPFINFFESNIDDIEERLIKNSRIDGTSGEVKSANEITSTCLIPCNPMYPIKLNNINFDYSSSIKGNYRIAMYNESKMFIGYVSLGAFTNNDYFSYDGADSCITFKNFTENSAIKDIKYIRICCNSSGIDYNSSITINGEDFYFKNSYLNYNVCVKEQNVEGLEKKYISLAQKSTNITSDSTDSQIPTAKAVYDAMQELLNYVIMTINNK